MNCAGSPLGGLYGRVFALGRSPPEPAASIMCECRGAVVPTESVRFQLREPALQTRLPSLPTIFYFIYFGYPALFIVANERFPFHCPCWAENSVMR